MPVSVTYTAVLTVRRETVLFVSALLFRERLHRGTRTGTRALTCFAQAVLVIRWFLDGTRVIQLAGDNAISKSTALRSGPLAGVSPFWAAAARSRDQRSYA